MPKLIKEKEILSRNAKVYQKYPMKKIKRNTKNSNKIKIKHRKK